MRTRIRVASLAGIFSMAVFWGCAAPDNQLASAKPKERTETRQCPTLPVFVMSNDAVVKEAEISMLYVNTKTPPRLVVDKSLQTKEHYIINVFEMTPDNQCVLQKDTCIPMSVSIKTTDMRMSIDRVYDTIVGIVWNFANSNMMFTTDNVTYITKKPNSQIRFTKGGIVLDGIEKKQ